MKTWHAGEEVETEGEIVSYSGGYFYKATVTNHPENTNTKIGASVLMACYAHPEVAEHFGTKVYTDPNPRGKMG